MTVKELITLLQKEASPDDLIILSSDGEGNAFHLLRDYSLNMFDPEEDEIHERELTSEMEQQGYTREDIGDPEQGHKNCIVLWP